MTISPKKQRQIEKTAGLVGEAFGALIGTAIVAGVFYAIVAGVFYAILHLLIGLSVTYAQVFGVLLILDFLKNFLKNK